MRKTFPRTVRRRSVCAPSWPPASPADSRARAASWKRCAARPWSARTPFRPVPSSRAARSICERLPPGHQHRQQRHETRALGVPARMDGRAGRRRPLHLLPHRRRDPTRHPGEARRPRARPARGLVRRAGGPVRPVRRTGAAVRRECRSRVGRPDGAGQGRRPPAQRARHDRRRHRRGQRPHRGHRQRTGFPGRPDLQPGPAPDRAALRARSASFSRSRSSDRAEVLSRRIGPHRGPLGRLSRGSRRSRYPLAPLRRLRAQPFHYSINIKKSNIHMNIIHQTDAPDGTMTPGPTGEPGPGSWTHCRPSRRIA